MAQEYFRRTVFALRAGAGTPPSPNIGLYSGAEAGCGGAAGLGRLKIKLNHAGFRMNTGEAPSGLEPLYEALQASA